MRNNNWLIAVVVAAIACSSARNANGVLVFSADFSTAGRGFTHTTSTPPAASPFNGPNWIASYTSAPASDTTLNEFVTSGGAMRIQDWGGSATLESSSINVSLYDTVDLDGIFAAFGPSPVSPENLTFFYTLDGGARVNTVVNSMSVAPANWNIDGLNVSSVSLMTVGFTFNVDGAGQGWTISALTVNGFVSAVPEASAFLFGGLACSVAGVAAVVRKRRACKAAA